MSHKAGDKSQQGGTARHTDLLAGCDSLVELFLGSFGREGRLAREQSSLFERNLRKNVDCRQGVETECEVVAQAQVVSLN